ncbi:MAG: pyridoxamine 5'-phosphate oxidase [Actinomycetota bacterium]|nr:pyridoxamine 5'-phosphate oxidase [Actinomycetota bacterium]
MPPESPLRRRHLDPDPLRQFESWFGRARTAGVSVPEAMAVATASGDGAPSVRMVLLRSVDERGFVFNTNYESRKARDLAENPRAALLFYWHELGRQIRIEGDVARVEPGEADIYFATRPRGSRLSAWASRQSEVVGARAELEAQWRAADERYAGDVPRPPFWGGLRVTPASYEFWQHHEDRLHDRFRYRREAGAWVIDRLAP